MVEHGARQRLAEYLTVGEAAEFLGVSPWTLRNWDRAGRLRAVRHPKNGYRIYRQQDLEAVLDPGDVYAPTGTRRSQIDWSQVASARLAEVAAWQQADEVARNLLQPLTPGRLEGLL